MRRALAVCVACAIAIAATREARASDASFDLDYRAPATCPTEDAFVADVRSRLVDRGPAIGDRRAFQIRIAEEEAAFRGSLETREPPSMREVAGATCVEVARALVVFLALAMSPADAPEPSERAPASSPTPRPPDGPRATPPPPVAGAAAAPSPGRLRVALDARALAAMGIAPGPAPGGALSAAVALEPRRSLRWVLRAGGAATYAEASAAFGGAFTFLWWAARVDGGPAVELGPVQVSAGPVLHAGVLAVRARNLPSAARSDSFWGDVGAFARVDRRVTSHLSVSAMVEVAAPLQRRSFGIQGVEAPVHEVPPLVGIASIGFTLGP